MKSTLINGLGFYPCSEKRKRMVGYFYTQCFFDRNYNFLYAGITKLEHFTAFDIDKMVVLFKPKRFLELRTLIPELMFGN